MLRHSNTVKSESEEKKSVRTSCVRVFVCGERTGGGAREDLQPVGDESLLHIVAAEQRLGRRAGGGDGAQYRRHLVDGADVRVDERRGGGGVGFRGGGGDGRRAGELRGDSDSGAARRRRVQVQRESAHCPRGLCCPVFDVWCVVCQVVCCECACTGESWNGDISTHLTKKRVVCTVYLF
jgi:hypothetical protein